ncbi:MAG: ankyrin repeat domain-containing protein [Gimesia chilikensis]|uniref:ankyrin repeat domain-containing protein n=1 Tax=Gimesia chilikensis TaxID=2605989 RepID=UPI00379F91CB
MSNKNFDQFVIAIVEGNVEIVEQYLDDGYDPNGPDDLKGHERPLSQALLGKQFQIADLLLEAGAQPRYGAWFLDDYLGQEEYEPYIEKILDDACPEISKSLQQAFLKALKLGDRPLAERLFTLCPPPGEFTTRLTPLCEMILADNEEMALWMIGLGFDHTNINENEDSPSHLAVLADQPKVLQKLFDLGESPEMRVNGHQTNLTMASLYGKLRHVRDYPKNEKYEVFHEGNLLHVAAVAGSPRCAKVLLEAGLDPHEKDSEGHTPAILATLGGDATRDVLELLPESDLTDGTVLVDLLASSIINNDVEGVRRTLDKGVDPSTTIKAPKWVEDAPFLGQEASPLIYAAGLGYMEILQILVNAGADLERDDWPENTKRDATGLKEMIEYSSFDSLLNQPMIGGRTPLGFAALAGKAEAIKILVDAGANTQARDIFDFTVLHLAAMSDKPAAVEAALGLGIDIHAEAVDKMTPLHAAAAVNAVKAIPLLIEAGADTTRIDKNGETPFMTAKEWGKPGARNKLEPHTPKEFQKKKRKQKKKVPEWEWSREKFDALLKKVRKSHGKEGKQLATQKFRNKLAKAVRSKEFLTTVEEVRKKLKAGELGTWDDSPHLVWMELEKITPNRLLKVQEEFLEKGAFVVRALSSFQGSLRVFVVPTTKLPELLGAFGINGVNMGLDPDLTIAWLLDLYYRHPYRVVGISYDGIEFRFDEPISEPNDLVQELMIACPPELDKNKEIQQLRRKLKSKTPRVFLWWD